MFEWKRNTDHLNQIFQSMCKNWKWPATLASTVAFFYMSSSSSPSLSQCAWRTWSEGWRAVSSSCITAPPPGPCPGFCNKRPVLPIHTTHMLLLNHPLLMQLIIPLYLLPFKCKIMDLKYFQFKNCLQIQQCGWICMDSVCLCSQTALLKVHFY